MCHGFGLFESIMLESFIMSFCFKNNCGISTSIFPVYGFCSFESIKFCCFCL